MLIKLSSNENTSYILNDLTLAPVFASGIRPPFVYAANNQEALEHASIIFKNCGLTVSVDVNKFMLDGQNILLITHDMLMNKIPRKLFLNLKLKTGEKTTIKSVTETLSKFGYTREHTVGMQNEFSVRGDIIDFWQKNDPTPTRVIFFGNTIETINFIDAKTFTRLNEITCLNIQPAKDVFDHENLQTIPEAVENITKTIVAEKVHGLDVSNGQLPFKPDKTEKIRTAPVSNFFSALSVLVPEIIWNVNTRGKTVLVFVGDSHACEKYMESKGISYIMSTLENFVPQKINIIHRELGVSFELPDQDLVIYSTGTQPFSNTKSSYKQTRGYSTELRSSNYNDYDSYENQTALPPFTLPQVGELVIHEKHGLGRYLGIKKMNLADTERDYIVLQYDGGTFVYLPPENTHELSNYYGSPRRLSRI